MKPDVFRRAVFGLGLVPQRCVNLKAPVGKKLRFTLLLIKVQNSPHRIIFNPVFVKIFDHVFLRPAADNVNLNAPLADFMTELGKKPRRRRNHPVKVNSYFASHCLYPPRYPFKRHPSPRYSAPLVARGIFTPVAPPSLPVAFSHP